MIKAVRLRAVVSSACALALALTFATALSAGAAETDNLSYSIKEARAYAYKASLSKEAIEAVGRVAPCDPAEDPYECDEGRYNHEPNCPPKIALGPEGKAPKPASPDTESTEGGAGDTTAETEPPQSSPVRLNEIISLATLSRFGPIKEAAGFASKQYVDLSGRSEPEAHTESEAYSGNKAPYEERCFPKEGAQEGNDYAHQLSRSFKDVHTYHLSECYREGCSGFGEPTPGMFGASAERAVSIVELEEVGSKVVGTLSANLEELSYGSGAFTVDSIETFVRFESDGTPQGLEWSVTSTASGVHMAGQKITLPPGEMLAGPGFAVGMATPYVAAEADGSKIRIVAPGLVIAHDEQAAYFGGAETSAGFGEGLGVGFIPSGNTGNDFSDTADTSDDFSSNDFGGGAASFGSDTFGGGVALGATDTSDPLAAEPSSEVLIYEQATGRGAVAAIVALGIIGWFLLLGRWLQRFTWGRKLYQLQPFRTIDWLYRAFVKT
jgi:hypothetical protein